MTERARINRRITPSEIEVIRAALEGASKGIEYRALADQLDALRAVDRCHCGCASVDFAKPNPASQPVPIADAMGKTLSGGDVGVIVWGTSEGITDLEIYDLGAGDRDLTLPVASTIVPFEPSAA